jgi:hypothetical protein
MFNSNPLWGGFTADSHWVIASATGPGEIVAIPVDGESPGESLVLSEGTASFSARAPNSRAIVFQKEEEKALYLVEWSDSGVTGRRKVSDDDVEQVFAYSADSSSLAYIGTTFDNLYVANVLDPEGLAANASKLPSTAGNDVLTFQYQP